MDNQIIINGVDLKMTKNEVQYLITALNEAVAKGTITYDLKVDVVKALNTKVA